MATQPKTSETTETVKPVENSKTVTFTGEQRVLLRTILNRAMQVALSEAGRTPNAREAVKYVQSVIDLDDLLN